MTSIAEVRQRRVVQGARTHMLDWLDNHPPLTMRGGLKRLRADTITSLACSVPLITITQSANGDTVLLSIEPFGDDPAIHAQVIPSLKSLRRALRGRRRLLADVLLDDHRVLVRLSRHVLTRLSERAGVDVMQPDGVDALVGGLRGFTEALLRVDAPADTQVLEVRADGLRWVLRRQGIGDLFTLVTVLPA